MTHSTSGGLARKDRGARRKCRKTRSTRTEELARLERSDRTEAGRCPTVGPAEMLSAGRPENVHVSDRAESSFKLL